MKIRNVLITLIVLLQLSGCTSTVNIIDKQNNPFRYTPNSAVIIVGGIGETNVGNLTVNTMSGKKLFSVSENSSLHINTFAWKISLGDTFTLISAEMSDWHSNLAFSKPHTLSINKSGIYYYGSIISKDMNILLIKKSLPMLIDNAKKKYPYVFNELTPVNFQ